MQITTLLVEPSLDNIEKELHDLAAKIPQEKKAFNDNQELLVKVCALLSDLTHLKKEISVSNLQPGGVVPEAVYTELRRLKRQTHFARRNFLKMKSNESRFEKMAVRRNDVSTVAA